MYEIMNLVVKKSDNVHLTVYQTKETNNSWWFAFRNFLPHVLKESHSWACKELGILETDYIPLESMIEAICFWENADLVLTPNVETESNKLLISLIRRKDYESLASKVGSYYISNNDIAKSNPDESNFYIYLMENDSEKILLHMEKPKIEKCSIKDYISTNIKGSNKGYEKTLCKSWEMRIIDDILKRNY